MFLRIIFLLVFILPSIIGSSQSEFSIEDCIEHALQNAWRMKENQLNIADAEAQIREYRAQGLPQINGSIDLLHYLELPTSIFPAGSFGPANPAEDLEVKFGVQNNLTASVGMNTLLFSGSYLIGLKAIKRYLNLVQQQGNLNISELNYMVREAFYRVILSQAAEELLESNIANLEKSLVETRAIYTEGFIEKLDVDRLELSLNNLKLQRINQSKTTEQSRNALKFQMNFPLSKNLNLKGNLLDYMSSDAQVKNLDEIKSEAGRRPEYQVMEASKVLRGMDVQRQKYSRFPTIAGYGSYNQQLQGNNLSTGSWFPFSLVGAKLIVPIFNGFDIRSKIERAEIALSKVELQQSQFGAVADIEVRNSVIAVENARKTLIQRTLTLEQAQNIYNVTKIKFQEGVGSSFELTQAERELFVTQGNMVTAMYELIIADMNLDKALGML